MLFPLPFFKKKFPYLCIFTGILLSINIIIFSLPLLSLGLWSASEQAITLTHLSAFLVITGLLIFALTSERYLQRIYKILSHPFVFLPLCIGFWSMISTLWQPLPWRGFFGVPELGEGAFSYVSIGVIIAGGIFLYPIKKARAFITLNAGCVLTLILLLTFLKKTEVLDFVPYTFNDYLAFFTLEASLVLFTFGSRSLKRKKLFYFYSILGSLLCVGLYLSNNVTAMAITLFFGLLLFSITRIPPLKHHFKFLISFTTFVFPLSLTAIILSFGILGIKGEESFRGLPFASYLASTLSRSHLITPVIKNIKDDPSNLLWGEGWGSYSDIHAYYLPTDWVDMTGEAGNGKWEGTWRAHFHSHNMYLDTLISIGLPGLFLFWLWLLITPYYCRDRYLLAAGIYIAIFSCLASQWFQMPTSLSFFALAFAGIARPIRFRTKSTISFFLKPLVKALCCFIFLITSVAAFVNTLILLQPVFLVIPELPAASTTCNKPYFNDFGRGGIHHSELIRYISGELLEQIPEIQQVFKDRSIPYYAKATKKLDPHAFAQLNYMLCQATYNIDNKKASLRLELAALLVRSDIALAMEPYLPPDSTGYALHDWDQRIRAFITKAPGRSDQAVPYMIWQFKKGNEAEVMQMAQFLLRLNPEDPGGLWFAGLVMLNEPQHAHRGLEYMKKALSLGVDHRIPVDKNIREQLLNAS